MPSAVTPKRAGDMCAGDANVASGTAPLADRRRLALRRTCAAALLAALLGSLPAAPARAEGERAGAFDYYVLSLSWSPTWCATEGSGRNSPQCAPGAGFGWVLHGLWPQNERGWPSYCRTTERDPARSETAAMADVMGDGGAAWYQWKKHGRCAGLSPDAYFATARRALESIAKPEVLARLDRPVKLPAAVVEQAFLEANPALGPDMITITCDAGRIEEVRICLSASLTPRACGQDVVADCRMRDALMAPRR